MAGNRQPLSNKLKTKTAKSLRLAPTYTIIAVVSRPGPKQREIRALQRNYILCLCQVEKPHNFQDSKFKNELKVAEPQAPNAARLYILLLLVTLLCDATV